MNKKLLLKPIMLIAGTSLLLMGCAVREQAYYRNPTVALVESMPPSGVVYVNNGPPAPVADLVTVTPGPGFVWIGGAWYWEGRWVWHSGYWGRPPRFNAVWVGPRYVYRGHRHVWYRGYWR